MVSNWSAGHSSGEEHAVTRERAQESPQPAEPLPGDLVGREDLTGRRIAAALVDVALLTGLFTIMGVTVGDTTAGGGSFHVTLNWEWGCVYLALLLLYYFVLEAATGQTLGKGLLGLQVVRRDGGRPSPWAVARRTLLRLIDWLPVLYLVGFITMLATGRHRRQRLGDLAAETAIARAVPVRHRGLMLSPLVLILLAALGLSAYRITSAGGSETYQGHGVTFDYPAGWQEAGLPVDLALGQVRLKLWSTARAQDPADWIDVAGYRLNPPVPAVGSGPVPPAVKTAFRHMFEHLGGVLQAGPQEITMGGMRALSVRGTRLHEGISTENTIVFAFNGTTEYVLICENGREHAAEAVRACGKIVRTFKVSKTAQYGSS